MPTIANSIDKLIDALAGENVIMDSPTIAGRIEQLADAIEDGDITIGGGSGGGASILRCSLTYTGAGTEADPRVGHLDHASEILDALDRESSYDPIIVISWAYDMNMGQLIPAAVEHRADIVSDGTMEMEYLIAYGAITTQDPSGGVHASYRRFRLRPDVYG